MNDTKGALAGMRGPFFDPHRVEALPEVTPLGFVSGRDAMDLCEQGAAFALAGGPLAFTHMRLGGEILGAAEIRRWAEQAGIVGDAGPAHCLEMMSAPRAAYADLPISGARGRPRIMGVCNVTPDSFSDGGKHAAPHAAIGFARDLVRAGVDIIDIGGESTRPGAVPVSTTEEMDRVLPVVEALAGDGVKLSIDTRNADVMQAALEAGASIINDITALTGSGALDVAAASGASVILMHMQGSPATMQDDPRYDAVVSDIFDWLATRVAACVQAGISLDRIAVDPGFGFGKTLAHNVALLADLGRFHGLGCALAVGLSRKSFLGTLGGEEDPAARVVSSVTAALDAVGRGAQILRVHDVVETRQALAVWRGAAGLAT